MVFMIIVSLSKNNYLEIGRVFNISKGDPFKYRNENMRKTGEEIGYHTVKNFNPTRVDYKQSEARDIVEEFLFRPVSVIKNDIDYSELSHVSSL